MIGLVLILKYIQYTYLLGVFIYFWYVATNKFSWHWFTSLKSHNCHDFSLHHELVFDDMNLHMVYIWSSLLQLTVESCDLSQADNLFTAVTNWINLLLSLKMTNFHPVQYQLDNYEPNKQYDDHKLKFDWINLMQWL